MCSPVCGEMLEEGEEVSHDYEDGSRPGLDQLPHLDHELVLGLQLCKVKWVNFKIEALFKQVIHDCIYESGWLINYHGWSDCV